MPAIDDIAAERRRQIEAEGWTPEHDDEHRAGALATAAACYAAPETVFYGMSRAGPAYQTFISYEPAWPWADMWWKPSGDRRRDLVKAGALIVAEIERLDRASPSTPGTENAGE